MSALVPYASPSESDVVRMQTMWVPFEQQSASVWQFVVPESYGWRIIVAQISVLMGAGGGTRQLYLQWDDAASGSYVRYYTARGPTAGVFVNASWMINTTTFFDNTLANAWVEVTSISDVILGSGSTVFVAIDNVGVGDKIEAPASALVEVYRLDAASQNPSPQDASVPPLVPLL